MSTRGRLTDVEQSLEALSGAIRALEARLQKVEGAVAAITADRKKQAAVETKAPQEVPPPRDRALGHVVGSVDRLVEAVKQLQEIIEPDDPVPLDGPMVPKLAKPKAPAADRPAAARERRKLPQVRRADEEAEKAAAAELAEHEAWLQDLRQRLTSGQATDDKGGK